LPGKPVGGVKKSLYQFSVCIALFVAGWFAARAVSPPVVSEGERREVPSVKNPTTGATPDGSEQHSITEFLAGLEKIYSGPLVAITIEKYLYEKVGHLPAEVFPSYLKAMDESSNVGVRGCAPGVFDLWLAKDFAAARSWAQKNKSRFRDNFLGITSALWVRKDPDGMFQWFESLEPNARRTAMSDFSPALRIMREKDPLRVVDWMCKQGSVVASNNAAEAFAVLAKKDPQTAAERATQLAVAEYRTEAIKSVVFEWARNDPAGAQKWVESQTDQRVVQTAQAAYVSGLRMANPRAAVEHVANLPLTAETQKELFPAVQKWAASKPDEALAWASGIKDAEVQHTALEAVFTSIAQKDPERAVVLISERSANFSVRSDLWDTLLGACLQKGGVAQAEAVIAKMPDSSRDDGMVNLAGLIERRFPQDYFEKWVMAQPEGPARQSGIGRMATIRYGQNKKSAVEWASALPPSPSRERAISSMAMRMWYESSDEAAAFALGKMADRQSALAVISVRFSEWAAEDRKRAQEWLQKSKALSDQEKAQILK
jgi:hypothetical protein